MGGGSGSVDELLERVASGDSDALNQLLSANRGRLRQMIDVRLDERLRARVDPSDVIQETLTEASRRMPEYLRERPLPFYAWLRRLTLDRLTRIHRRHLRTQLRSVRREAPFRPVLSDDSIARLNYVLSGRSGPMQRLLRAELKERVQTALQQLAEDDREVLVLRFLENLTVMETAAVAEVTENAVRMRQMRALQRFQKLLGMRESEAGL